MPRVLKWNGLFADGPGRTAPGSGRPRVAALRRPPRGAALSPNLPALMKGPETPGSHAELQQQEAREAGGCQSGPPLRLRREQQRRPRQSRRPCRRWWGRANASPPGKSASKPTIQKGEMVMMRPAMPLEPGFCGRRKPARHCRRSSVKKPLKHAAASSFPARQVKPAHPCPTHQDAARDDVAHRYQSRAEETPPGPCVYPGTWFPRISTRLPGPRYGRNCGWWDK